MFSLTTLRRQSVAVTAISSSIGSKVTGKLLRRLLWRLINSISANVNQMFQIFYSSWFKQGFVSCLLWLLQFVG